MRYGYFDDQNKEYVITTPKTPLPWINYLGCEEFFTMISNTGGGYSFYKDAKLLRLTRFRYNNTPKDSNGHYFYIKDGDTIWMDLDRKAGVSEVAQREMSTRTLEMSIN